MSRPAKQLTLPDAEPRPAYDDLPPLPDGFKRVSGKRAPPDPEARWFIQLRTGFADTRVSYTRDQLVWVWNGGPGDVVAVKRA